MRGNTPPRCGRVGEADGIAFRLSNAFPDAKSRPFFPLNPEGRTLETQGRHLLVEYWGCDSQALDELGAVEALMKRAAVAAGATIVTSTFHRFSPQGVSGVVVVEESHLSIHTWPERGYAAIDFYTCGNCRPDKAHAVLAQGLKPQRTEHMVVHRGLRPAVPSMVIERHVTDRTETGGHDASSGADEASDGEPFIWSTAPSTGSFAC
jgi:S-adenosylmethionine decarboxylase